MTSKDLRALRQGPKNKLAGFLAPSCRDLATAQGAARWVLVSGFCLLFGILPVTRADEAKTKEPDFTSLSLEELGMIKVPTVFGASGYAQKTTEAPSSVSILTQDDFQRYGYRTLADALQSLQGFHVSNDRNYSFLGARGINLGDFNSRTLLLIDGHRVNNNLTDGAYLGSEFLLDVDLIDRVEVIRGPGSVLYGNNALFGVINVITRKGRQINGVEVSGEYASYDTYKGRVTIGKSFTNGVELLLSGTLVDSAGPEQLYYKEFNHPANNNGIAQDMAAESSGNFFGSLTYRDFTLQGAFSKREKVDPTAQQFTTFNDPRLVSTSDRSYVELKFTHQFPEVVDVTAKVSYDRNDFKIDYPSGNPVATAVYHEVQAGEWWGAELQLNKRIYDRHVITLGAEYRDDFLQEKQVFDDIRTYKDLHASRQSYGVFVQGELELLTNLHFTGGLRYDRYGDFDPSLNPRLALIYNPWKQSAFKALYGTAFRTPNFLELSDSRFRDIKPEEITSYELIYEQGIGAHVRSSLAGFYNQMDRLITFESGSFANINAESRGAEVMVEGNWTGGIRGRASYTIQKTRNLSSNADFTDSPEQLFKFNLSVPLVEEKLIASLEYQHTSSRHTSFSNTSGATVPGLDTEGFGVVNVTLFSHDLLKNLDISASVYNLLDKSYADPSTRYHQQDQLPRDGRTFRVKLTYRF